ncbi:MAG: hypothetical protein AAF805_14275, partial [Planctomycetota bacterium]
ADRSGAFRLDSPDRAATRWVLQKLVDGEWTAKVIGASTTEVRVRGAASALAVSAVDAVGRQSEPTVVPLGD